jgi:hypothetical protein
LRFLLFLRFEHTILALRENNKKFSCFWIFVCLYALTGSNKFFNLLSSSNLPWRLIYLSNREKILLLLLSLSVKCRASLLAVLIFKNRQKMLLFFKVSSGMSFLKALKAFSWLSLSDINFVFIDYVIRYILNRLSCLFKSMIL